MPALLSTAVHLLYPGVVRQTTLNHDSGGQRRGGTPITSIGAVNDDSLLKIFRYCRPVHLDEDRSNDNCISEDRKGDSERWWYSLAQVCRKWRYLVLASASHLRLSLVFTYGMPIADMLAHSPPLPLIIDYGDEDQEVTTEDEEAILLALQRHRRVRHIRLCLASSKLQKLALAMDGVFPALECLHIKSLNDTDPGLVFRFPETFNAPRLRHLSLRNATHSPCVSRFTPPVPIAHQQSVESVEAIGHCARRCGAEFWRSLRTFIHTLDDHLLLKILYFTRPVLSNDEADLIQILHGQKPGHHWWYMITHVCRRWRYLVLSSASQLGLCLVCTYDTPVTDDLPPLLIIIDYGDGGYNVNAEDVRDVLFAPWCRRQIHHARLRMSTSGLRKLVVALGGEFPRLEYLHIKPLANGDDGLLLATFKTPHLRNFLLTNTTYYPGMWHLPPPDTHIQSSEVSKCVLCSGTEIWRALRVFINVLDDDSLLNVLRIYRSTIVDEDDTNNDRRPNRGKWHRENWWYKLAHVCRRWRRLILTSSFHLGVNLVCTNDVPVAVMLAHSPPLPLIIDYLGSERNITIEDEQGILLALQFCDRVRRIRLRMPFSKLQEVIMAMDKEFPILDYLHIGPSIAHDSALILPDTFGAPRLRHFLPRNFAIQLGSPLLTTAVGLNTLSLWWMYPAFVCPDSLLRLLSLLPRLEILGIGFHSPVRQRDVETHLLNRPVATHVKLQNLRWFGFEGSCTYMETLLPHMTTPLLEKLQIHLFHQPNFSVPHLQQFIDATENLRFCNAKFQFLNDLLLVEVYPHEGIPKYAFRLEIRSVHLDWQVVSASQIFRALRTVSSTVEQLSLVFRRNTVLLRRVVNNEVNRIQWRELLVSFNNVRTLCVHNDFRGQVSRSLQVNDGESPLEVLPELQEFKYNASRANSNAFQPFFDARRNVGRPVSWATFWL